MGVTEHGQGSGGMAEATEQIRNSEKLSFTFTGKALEDLREIAEREDKSLDEVIESALGLKKWALEVKDDGGTIIVRRAKADDRELVL
jgi:hypothetical protein